MKQILILAMTFAVFAFASCSKIKSEEKIPDVSESNFAVFEIYGQVHNELLQYVSDNFIETKSSVMTKSDGIDYILKLQQEGVNALDLSESEKKALKSGLECYKRLYITDNVYDMIGFQTKASTSDADNGDITTSDIKNLIYQAYTSNEIDKFEYELFMKLTDCVVANAQGKMGNKEFESKVNTLIRSWEARYANVDFSSIKTVEDIYLYNQSGFEVPKGSFSGTVLSISKSSLEYWNVTQLSTKAVPAFVGADIAGAIIGACSAAAGQLVTTGELSAGGILWGAGSCAITGSTGIVGKIGKWLSKLL